MMPIKPPCVVSADSHEKYTKQVLIVIHLIRVTLEINLSFWPIQTNTHANLLITFAQLHTMQNLQSEWVVNP